MDRVFETVTDQLGDECTFSFPPKRIISLVPSQTELLFDLGLDHQIAGITKFCVHPLAWLERKSIIGGTKNFWFDKIETIWPDLIIGNKEENYQEGIAILRQKFPVWMSDVTCYEDALAMISIVGKLTSREEESKVIADRIEIAFQQLRSPTSLSVLYLVWKKPWMAAGSNTFINSMIGRMGLKNCMSQSRYPALSPEEIRSFNPDVIFLPSEPYPFKEDDSLELKRILPDTKLIFVDGEMFSWYGSRMMSAPAYLNTVLIKCWQV